MSSSTLCLYEWWIRTIVYCYSYITPTYLWSILQRWLNSSGGTLWKFLILIFCISIVKKKKKEKTRSYERATEESCYMLQSKYVWGSPRIVEETGVPTESHHASANKVTISYTRNCSSTIWSSAVRGAMINNSSFRKHCC